MRPQPSHTALNSAQLPRFPLRFSVSAAHRPQRTSLVGFAGGVGGGSQLGRAQGDGHEGAGGAGGAVAVRGQPCGHRGVGGFDMEDDLPGPVRYCKGQRQASWRAAHRPAASAAVASVSTSQGGGSSPTLAPVARGFSDVGTHLAGQARRGAGMVLDGGLSWPHLADAQRPRVLIGHRCNAQGGVQVPGLRCGVPGWARIMSRLRRSLVVAIWRASSERCWPWLRA